MSDLKPCQCKNPAKLIDDYPFEGHSDKMYKVECRDCGMLTLWFDEAEDAINVWNNRPIETNLQSQLTAAKERVKGLEGLLDRAFKHWGMQDVPHRCPVFAEIKAALKAD